VPRDAARPPTIAHEAAPEAAIQKAIDAVYPALQKCLPSADGGAPGDAGVRQVRLSIGLVSSGLVRGVGSDASARVRDCMEAALRSASFPRWNGLPVAIELTVSPGKPAVRALAAADAGR
jgi:hypothetical protein